MVPRELTDLLAVDPLLLFPFRRFAFFCSLCNVGWVDLGFMYGSGLPRFLCADLGFFLLSFCGVPI